MRQLVMPQMDGIEAIRRIKTLNGNIKIIALTSFSEDDKVMTAIQSGASSYLLKDATPDDLVDAIRANPPRRSPFEPERHRKINGADCPSIRLQIA